MKKFFKSRFLITAIVIFGIVFSLSQTTFGQEVKGKATEKISSLTELIESQNRIAVALEELIIDEEEVENQQMEVRAMALASAGSDIQDCIAEIYDSPSSNAYKPPTGLNFDFLANTYSPSGEYEWRRENLIDLNADGLLDYFYANTTYGSFKTHTSCIYLNTGNGFEKEYGCRASYSSSYSFYQGDCADLS